MAYTCTVYRFPSSDGIHTVHAEIYAPTDAPIRGILQLEHGMIDYVARYRNLIEAMTAHGYLVAGDDHLGHGHTAATEEDLGFFADRDGVEHLIADVYTLNRYLSAQYPMLPIILMGHSMGSFLTRLYVERHPATVNAYVMHGTGGPNPALPVGKALAAVIATLRGGRYRSSLLARMTFAGYNRGFAKAEGRSAWLTRDQSQLADHASDPYTSFLFTVSGFRDLFRMVGGSNSRAWFRSYPKELPTLIVSGDRDPVGANGKGPTTVYKRLLIEGCRAVTLRLYPGARHELFNETCREEVFADLLAWIESVIR